MQVLTLHPDEFSRHARRLAELVLANHPAPFDAIIGIRNGGSVVCDAFCRYFPAQNCLCRTDITLQRPSSKRKRGVVSKILKHLPYGLLDVMRIAESRLLEYRGQTSRSAPPEVKIDETLRRILSSKPSPEILIIDDAIDSGITLRCILDALLAVNPRSRILTAVFTETTPTSKVKADFALYRNRTLIRFPWSHDYKPL